MLEEENSFRAAYAEADILDIVKRGYAWDVPGVQQCMLERVT
jgi:hypothetical protein